MDGISALMDGELGANEARAQFAKLKSDDEARSRWDEFHVIGDALRGESLLSARFTENLARRLAEEPTVLAPRRIIPHPVRRAAYALSAAASVGALALAAWMALTGTPDGSLVTERQESNPQPVVEFAAQYSVPNDGSANDLLLVHHGISPSSNLQGVASYIRTISEVRPREPR